MTKIKVIGVLCTILFLLLCANNTHAETAKCTRVIDGDTIVVDYHGKLEKVRLIGVDTPETMHPSKPVEYFGKEASNFTRSLVADKGLWETSANQTRAEIHQVKSNKAPTDEDACDKIVYVTKTGKKYHRGGCRYLRKSRIPIKLCDAIDAGYTPCKVCRPPIP